MRLMLDNADMNYEYENGTGSIPTVVLIKLKLCTLSLVVCLRVTMGSISKHVLVWPSPLFVKLHTNLIIRLVILVH